MARTITTKAPVAAAAPAPAPATANAPNNATPQLPLAAKANAKESMADEELLNEMVTVLCYELLKHNIALPSELISGVSRQNRTVSAIEHKLRPHRRVAETLAEILNNDAKAFPPKVSGRKTPMTKKRKLALAEEEAALASILATTDQSAIDSPENESQAPIKDEDEDEEAEVEIPLKRVKKE